MRPRGAWHARAVPLPPACTVTCFARLGSNMVIPTLQLEFGTMVGLKVVNCRDNEDFQRFRGLESLNWKLSQRGSRKIRSGIA
eukprot:3248471-Prymnesium_polylepis.1